MGGYRYILKHSTYRNNTNSSASYSNPYGGICYLSISAGALGLTIDNKNVYDSNVFYNGTIYNNIIMVVPFGKTITISPTSTSTNWCGEIFYYYREAETE